MDKRRKVMEVYSAVINICLPNMIKKERTWKKKIQEKSENKQVGEVGQWMVGDCGHLHEHVQFPGSCRCGSNQHLSSSWTPGSFLLRANAQKNFLFNLGLTGGRERVKCIDVYFRKQTLYKHSALFLCMQLFCLSCVCVASPPEGGHATSAWTSQRNWASITDVFQLKSCTSHILRTCLRP